jgi:hypothetical protein
MLKVAWSQLVSKRATIRGERVGTVARITSGVPRGEVWVVQNPSTKFQSFDKDEPNSQFRGKYIRNNLTRIRISLIWKLSGTLSRGLPPPDPRSLCPLSSTDFVEHPPPLKNPGYATANNRGNGCAKTDTSQWHVCVCVCVRACVCQKSRIN